uniref:Protein TIC 214 n=1 Tax=Mimosa pudica TaxID=76306 RepID=A0A4V1GPW8_MIMPU|nr:hypothetical chloroplast RF1 [Mimosa pudica]QCT83242.1 hypothetical chloroplast RF1 [Mimosa pudica]
MSQFFFHTCQSDAKERISFTYPPSLSTFLEMMQRKTSLFTTEKLSYDELDNRWHYINEQKKNNLSNQFLNRAEALDKEFFAFDVLEKKIRLWDEETKKYLPKIYDPFLNGPYRGRIKKSFLFNKTYTKNDIWINKIHVSLLNTNTYYPDKIDRFNKKSLSNEIRFFVNLINEFYGKLVSKLNFNPNIISFFRENKNKDSEAIKIKLIFDAVLIDALFDAFLTIAEIEIDENNKTRKCIEIKENSKKVPRWSYKFIDEVDQLESEREDSEIRSRKAKRVVIYNLDTDYPANTYYTADTDNSDEKEKNELALIDFSSQPDFRREIIKGSSRAQRRKTINFKIFQTGPHSPLFMDKTDKPFFFSFEIFELIKIFFRNWTVKNQNTELKILDSKDSKGETKQDIKQKEDIKRMEIAEAWETVLYGQGIRAFLLIAQKMIRKYIVLPSLIITKNIVRILLFQSPEWSEDFKEWNREVYIKCTYNGVPLSETEFPKNWLNDGLQIKVLFPFRLKPWHRYRSKLQPPQKEKDQMKKKVKKKPDFFFLTVFGAEVEFPFSPSPPNQVSFFDPDFFDLVFKKLKKKFINIPKETEQSTIQSILKKILFLKEEISLSLSILKEKISLSNLLFIFGLKKISELNEIQKDSTKTKSNSMSYESTIPIQSINWTDCSLTEKKIKDLNDRTKKMIKQIENFQKDKKYDDKKFKLQKNIWQILQKRNTRLFRKSHYFFKFFIERVYIDIFLCIINIPRINVQLFLESTKKILNIYNNNNNEASKERKRNDKKNQNIIHFISTIKNSNSNIRNKNSQNFWDVSSLSQAYVFYKFSQINLYKYQINLYKYKLRSLFEDHGTPLFLKNEIKDYFFGVQEKSHSKLKHKGAPNSVMNQWTNWLKGHYQYDLSKNEWSRLVSKKWRNKMNEHDVTQNQDLTKYDSSEKNGLILYKKQEIDSLKKKKKMKKQYEYDLLSYKFINYADSYIYGYRESLQVNNNQAISSNRNVRKNKKLDMTDEIPIKNYLVEDSILAMQKNLDRKCFDWRILNFCFRKKVHLGYSINTDYYLFNKTKNLFDWMGMNVEILNNYIANREFFFFSKIFIFYNAYTSNPWIIPIKLLFFNLNINKNVSEKEKYLELELETQNKPKTESASQLNLETSLSKKEEKDVKEDSAGSDIKNDEKKNRYTNSFELELNSSINRYFLFQLYWTTFVNEKIMNNIKIYCLLLRQKYIKEIAVSSIQRGKLSLDIMKIQKDLTLLDTELNKNTKLMKKRIFSMKPIRLSRKNNEQFNMYQTIGLSLIHKRKHQINQRYREKSYVEKKNLEKSIKKSITRTRDQKMTENKEKTNSNLLVPENILSARRRRELRILISLNPGNRNRAFYNENNCYQVLATSKGLDLDRDKKKLINFKLFLWPNYRLEDLACINRYWFDTNNGSRFSMIRIHMYPRLKIR